MNNRHERLVELLERITDDTEQGRTSSFEDLGVQYADLYPDIERCARFLSRLDRLAQPGDLAEATGVHERPSTMSGGLAPSADVISLPAIPNHEIVGLLGQGGMGAVYKARDRRLGRVVALKVIKEGLAGAAAVARFQREAESIARLNHPHIVQIHEVGQWQPPTGGPLPFLSLEYVEGKTLDEIVGKQPADPRESARLLRLLARAVQAAHAKGIIHRDLKPANVLLAPPADEPALNCAWGHPKLSDFGLARPIAVIGEQTTPGSIVGTPNYMAPEQAEGCGDLGPAADVYSLGAILYRLLTGRPPFVGSGMEVLFQLTREKPAPPRRLRATVPIDLDALCMSCLERDPASRPTVPRLIETLGRFLDSELTVTVTFESPRRTALLSRLGVSGGLFGSTRKAARPDGSEEPSYEERSFRTGVIWPWLLAGGMVAAALLVAAGLAWRLEPAVNKGISLPETIAITPGENPEPPPPAARRLIRPIRVEHFERVTEDGVEKGVNREEIGSKAVVTRFNDQVSLVVELQEPAYVYLLAFNANGKEQLLWPTDEKNHPLPDARPGRVARLVFPRGGERFTLDDEKKGGLQVFVVLASRKPLPTYTEWKHQRGEVAWGWRRPNAKVWQADAEGVYEVVAGKGAVGRGGIDKPIDSAPVDELCRTLKTGGVEAVEAIAFGVLPRRDEP